MIVVVLIGALAKKVSLVEECVALWTLTIDTVNKKLSYISQSLKNVMK
jgi:hypothetical protein